MQKKFLVNLTGLLLAILLFWSCKKEIGDKNTDLEVESKSGHGSEKECQLSHLDWGDGSSWDLSYNRKGLADRWVFNNGDGTQNIFTMKYDNHDRLVRGTAEIPEGKFRIEFKYKGRLLVKEQWYNVADNSLFADKINHYDRKERIKMQEDIVSDSKVFYTYDINGNPLTVDLYFGGIIVFSSRFSYEISNRHPYLAIKGLPYTFPFYDAPSIGKRWESGAKYVFYDENGTAIVNSNADAANTVMQKGSRNYLTKLTAYDEVSQSNYVYTFSYQNCTSDWKEDNHPYAPQGMKARGIRSGKINLVVGDKQNVKRQLLEIRQELLRK
jgi:hypothetical protein